MNGDDDESSMKCISMKW